MIQHYIKIAFRNLWKYKTQSIISIIGLAVGFTCFALSTLWIRYEITFDTFHKDVKRMYLVGTTNIYGYGTSSLLAPYLKETFPEVENAVSIQHWGGAPLKKDGIEYPGSALFVDTASVRFFDIRIIEGSKDFMIPHSNNIAVTERYARKLAPDGNVIGLKVSIREAEFTICAIVKGWKAHSNISFDILQPIATEAEWFIPRYKTFLKLKTDIEPKAFTQKLLEHTIEKRGANINGLKLVSISKMRQEEKSDIYGVKFEYLFLFAIVGVLVIICVFINYFTLFSNRFRIRGKELGIRKICGANRMSLFLLLFTEFLIILSLSLLLGLLFIRLISSSFLELSGINSVFYSIYRESLIYILLIIVFSSIFFYVFLRILYKQSLSNLIKKAGRKRQNLSLVLQLIISIGFIFITSVMLKQVYYLYTTDLGFDYKNTASLRIFPNMIPPEVLKEKLKEIPEIEQTIISDFALIPHSHTLKTSLALDDKPENRNSNLKAEILYIDEDFIDFYKLKLINGDLPTEGDDSNTALITEATLKLFGWTEPIGEIFYIGLIPHKVKGVIQDIYSASPMVAPSPMIFIKEGDIKFTDNKTVLFRYKPGTLEQIKAKIYSWTNKEYSQASVFLIDANETFDEYMKSENALLKILSFAALVCVIVSLFGFYSIVSLVCESRRKELAIRKINGATMQTILSGFFKEYFMLLLVSSVIAFAISYIIMKRWLEHYVLQVDIPVWLYIVIFIAFAGIITLSIGQQIYKVSRENPADVLKRE